MKISVAIPTYEMHGRGAEFLGHIFVGLRFQIFQDFEVVISDHSLDNGIENLCSSWVSQLRIKYLRNNYKRGSSSANLNNAISHCEGEWIKILFQDDFLYSDDSMQSLSDFIDQNPKSKWIASACQHTRDGQNMYFEHFPRWNPMIRQGQNTISSPSVITFKNMGQNNVKFDENLLWLMDVDFYGKMFDRYGEPSYLNQVTVVNRVWEGSLSNTLSDVEKIKEENLFK